MEGHRKQLANSLVLAFALIAAVAIFLLPPSLQAQTQPQPKGIDPAVLAKANAGDASSQVSVGNTYAKGEGVPQDYAQAAAWYRKAAEQGDAVAQVKLGFLYLNGDGVSQDYTQAAAWYRKGAEQGVVGAQDI